MTQSTSWRGPGDEENYLASVSDLMVGLLFIFIILLMAFALNFRSAESEAKRVQDELSGATEQVARERNQLAKDRDRVAAERDRVAVQRDQLAAQRDELLQERDVLTNVTAELSRRDSTRRDLLQQLQLTLGEQNVPVVIDPDNGVLRLPESLLFDSGQAVLRPDGERALADLARLLADELPCYTEAPAELQKGCGETPTPLLEAVLIEGHTDDVPIRAADFSDNWELSAARGLSTFKALTTVAPELEQLKNARGEALLGVSGYEARRPVAHGESEEARRQNRQIDLRFLVAAPSAVEVSKLRDALDATAGRSGSEP